MAAMRAAGIHALVIEDDLMVSQAIEDQLVAAGFRSVDHADSPRRALALAQRRFPDLVVVGNNVDMRAGIDTARELSRSGEVAVMMVSADPSFRERPLPEDASLEGPYPFHQLSTAFDHARNNGEDSCL